MDFIIIDGTSQTIERNGILSFEELENRAGVCLSGKPFLQELLGDMLCNRPEVADLAIDNGCIDIVYYLNFLPNRQGTMQEEKGMKMQQ